MAKCHQCQSRKGKRHCPALEKEICPVCCAEGRLNTISCPITCPFLSAEHYQQRRRQERARSRGKGFIRLLEDLFPDPAERSFAFNLQADAYYFLSSSPADDASVARAFESVRNASSTIVVPVPGSDSLARFLLERLADPERYPARPGLDSKVRARILEKLIAHVGSLGGEGSHRYEELLSSFFGALDFEADLDYSPSDSEAGSAAAPRGAPGTLAPGAARGLSGPPPGGGRLGGPEIGPPRSPGGLILPFGLGE